MIFIHLKERMLPISDPVSYRFRDMANFLLKTDVFLTPFIQHQI